ncbi:hypothetical protein GCM10023310_50170 [Paenibacillus vulneris]
MVIIPIVVTFLPLISDGRLNEECKQQLHILTQHIARVHNDNDREIYEIALDLWNKKR